MVHSNSPAALISLELFKSKNFGQEVELPKVLESSELELLELSCLSSSVLSGKFSMSFYFARMILL